MSTNASPHQPGMYTGCSAADASLLSIISTGVTSGKPNIAIRDEFC